MENAALAPDAELGTIPSKACLRFGNSNVFPFFIRYFENHIEFCFILDIIPVFLDFILVLEDNIFFWEDESHVLCQALGVRKCYLLLDEGKGVIWLAHDEVRLVVSLDPKIPDSENHRVESDEVM